MAVSPEPSDEGPGLLIRVTPRGPADAYTSNHSPAEQGQREIRFALNRPHLDDTRFFDDSCGSEFQLVADRGLFRRRGAIPGIRLRSRHNRRR